MKHVPKTFPEPDEFKSYRESNPKNTWDQFRDEVPETYRMLRDELRKHQGGLCAYCEMSLITENEQIAHFHPKSDNKDRNWALEWNNLWLACKGGTQSWLNDDEAYLPPLPENISCDERKGNEILDEKIHSPNMIPVAPRIFRYEQQPDRIEICPDEENCKIANLDIQKVHDTIKAFNLNCPRLSKARLSSHKQLEQAIKKLRHSNIQNQLLGFHSLAEHHLKRNKDGLWPQFFTLIRWRFKNYAEQYLESINFQG